jgi:hypothetical protein
VPTNESPKLKAMRRDLAVKLANGKADARTWAQAIYEKAMGFLKHGSNAAVLSAEDLEKMTPAAREIAALAPAERRAYLEAVVETLALKFDDLLPHASKVVDGTNQKLPASRWL